MLSLITRILLLLVVLYSLGACNIQEGTPIPADADRESEGDSLAPDGDDPSVDGDDPPVDGDDPSVDGDDPPVDGDDPLVDGDDPPVDGDDPPVDGDDPPVDGDDPPVDGDEDSAPRLIAATYNTRLFFDMICHSGDCGEDSFEKQPSQSEFNSRAEEVAGAIATLGADVVMLQEIENEYCLNAINAKLGSPYPVAVMGEIGYDASLDVAILARGSFVDYVSHFHDPITGPGGEAEHFTRDFMEVHVTFQGRRVIAFTSHFKAKTGDDPVRRFAEAAGARDIITDVAADFPQALLVFGGDLNDFPGSDPIDELERGGHLLRVASDLPPSEQATYMHYDDGQAIDHIYLSLDGSGAYVAGSAKVFKGPYFGFGGSDHAALRATFALP